MASRGMDFYKTKGTHGVGNLNTFSIDVLPNGAIVTGADIDNFTLGELGFDADGNRTVTQLTDNTHKAVLVASVERRFIDGEQLCDFYNAVGEPVRCVLFNRIVRFETSSFTKNTGVTTLVNGMVAHFDVTTKKFIISDSASAHADYATSVNKFTVVDVDCTSIEGYPVVRLELNLA